MYFLLDRGLLLDKKDTNKKQPSCKRAAVHAKAKN
jgi:hypothetical protein